ncbi:hypothetical protein [Micromonospora haikouensis]|uniref:hypothetical protein n=1 Tax=Micromonospora haikouensis TaxID=686309 RepID=UPI003D8EE64F
MAEVLDGGMLLVSLPKVVLGEDTSLPLGSVILAQVRRDHRPRNHRSRSGPRRYPDHRRGPQPLALANSLDTMLTKAHARRLSLVLAHQALAGGRGGRAEAGHQRHRRSRPATQSSKRRSS